MLVATQPAPWEQRCFLKFKADKKMLFLLSFLIDGYILEGGRREFDTWCAGKTVAHKNNGGRRERPGAMNPGQTASEALPVHVGRG